MMTQKGHSGFVSPAGALRLANNVGAERAFRHVGRSVASRALRYDVVCLQSRAAVHVGASVSRVDVIQDQQTMQVTSRAPTNLATLT